jgi:hypothetical protein
MDTKELFTILDKTTPDEHRYVLQELLAGAYVIGEGKADWNNEINGADFVDHFCNLVGFLKLKASTREKPPTQEKITLEDGKSDCWICVCHNTAEADGFYPCNAEGNQIEPIAGVWSDLYVCAKCGRIIDQKTLEVIGTNPTPVLY